jgi:hypothetical protein
MDSDAILKRLKMAVGLNSLKLPSYLGVTEDNGVVTLSMKAIQQGKTAHGVLANMQQDDAAFEGWTICMKAAMPEWKFKLEWEFPEDRKNGHYQRFLYRAKRFSAFYTSWFSIADDGLNEIETHACISDSGKYMLNAPSGDPERTNDAEHSPENLLENTIIKTQPHELNHIFKVKKYHRQLPVGVFHGSVAKKNAIFTHGKSAVDIWGVAEGNTLIIFELKALGNRKIGAISELFFYAMVIRDEQKGLFIRTHQHGAEIKATSLIKAMLLAEDIHPLIKNPKVFELLNQPLKGAIEFGYVKMAQQYSFDKTY